MYMSTENAEKELTEEEKQKKAKVLKSKKERHEAKMKQLEADRRELFKNHTIYLEIVAELGKGIMIKPHLEQYIITYTHCSKSKFNKDLKKLIDLKLLSLETTKAASIIVITKPALALLRGRESQKEVSLSGVWTETNFTRSLMKNEYILDVYAPRCASYRGLIEILNETNLVKSSGANEDIAKVILDRAKGTANEDGAEKDYKYIKDSHENKKANLKKRKSKKPAEVEPEEADLEEVAKTTITRDKNFASINNLQARHMYITDSGEWFELTYMEVSKQLNYAKMKSDMDILSRCLRHIPVAHVTIDVVIPQSRKRTVEKVVAEWVRKRRIHFAITDITINIITLDVAGKYFRGVIAGVS